MRRISPLTIIFFTILLDALGFGILIPVIPQLIANPESSSYILSPGTSIQTGYIILGMLTAAFPLAMFISAPILGQLSDKFGRKPVLAICLAGTCLSYLVFGLGIFIRSIPLLFFARIVDGLTGGNIAVAQAVIADSSTPQDRAKSFGLMGAAFGLGFIMGPLVGGILSAQYGPLVPFIFAAVLSFIDVLLIIFVLPETHLTRNSEKKIRVSQSIHNIIGAFRIPGLSPIFITSFLMQAGFTFFVTFAAVFLSTQFGFTEAQVGYNFGYVGLWIIITQVAITRYVSRKKPEHIIVKYCLPLVPIGLLLYQLSHTPWQLILLVPLYVVPFALSSVMLTSLISKSASKNVQGEVMGINTSVQSLAQSIPPILSGFIAASLTVTAPIVVGAGIIACAAVFFWIFYKAPPRVIAQEV